MAVFKTEHSFNMQCSRKKQEYTPRRRADWIFEQRMGGDAIILDVWTSHNAMLWMGVSWRRWLLLALKKMHRYYPCPLTCARRTHGCRMGISLQAVPVPVNAEGLRIGLTASNTRLLNGQSCLLYSWKNNQRILMRNQIQPYFQLANSTWLWYNVFATRIL